MTEETDETEAENAEVKKAGCLKRLGIFALVFVIVLAGFLAWLNGPGFRWLGPKIAERYFGEKLGPGLALGGTILGGVDVFNLDFRTEGTLERLVIDRLETDYRLEELIKGKIRGIEGSGVHADIRLMEKEEEKEPVDFAAIGKTLNDLRTRVLPLDLDLEDVSLAVKRDEEVVVEIGDSSLRHEAGNELIELGVGTVTDGTGREVAPQDVRMIWSPSELTVDRLDLLPVAGVRDVVISLPEDGGIALEGAVRLGEAMLMLDVSKGIEDVRLDLKEGQLDFDTIAKGLGMDLPVEGKLTSLAADISRVYPDWKDAVGTVEAVVEDFSYAEWDVPQASLGLDIRDGEFTAKLAGNALGSDFTLNGGGEFEREALVGGEGGPPIRNVTGELSIGEVSGVLGELKKKFGFGMEVEDFPASELGGSWGVEFDEEGFRAVDLDVGLTAKEVEASPVRLDARFEDGVITLRELGTEGMENSGVYNIEEKTYAGREVLTNFNSASVEPWLKGLGLEAPGDGVFSLEWEGEGDLANDQNKGTISGLQGEWNWKDGQEGGLKSAPISAKGDSISYDWPGEVAVEGLEISTQGQTVNLDGKLADQRLELGRFEWREGGDLLAEGSGTMPMPQDFSDLEGFLESNDQPIDMEIKSQTLPLEKLKPWVPGLEKIGPGATGKVDLKLGGSLADPEVDARVELKDIEAPGQPDLPKSDISIDIQARDGVAKINGEAVAPDYAPATLSATMPFRPKEWAENPELLKNEPIEGTLDLPKIELSRFQELVPGVTEIGGVVEGRIKIGGKAGDPKIDGNVKLTEAKIKLKNDMIPALEGMNLDIGTDLNKITVKGSITDIEGGNVNVDGSIALKNPDGEGLGKMDVTITGRGLPVMRNEYLIMRANLDLKVKGGMDDAMVTGEVGVIDSVFYKDMELIPIGKPFLEPSAAALPKIDTLKDPGFGVPAPFDKWGVDVVVRTIDPILIRGNLGKGQVEAAIRVEGTLGDPKPNGKARLSNAVARLPFSTLEIREGYLNFTPQTGFDPEVEIRGTSEPRPYRVQIYVYGRMSDPQLVLTSQPPLPDTEIMTLLATGTTTEGLEDTQAATSRAMQLLIEEIRRGRFLFGKQLRPYLGFLDNVDFSLAETDPYDSDSYSSAQVKLSDKWYISAGVGSEGGQRVLAIYRLRFR